MGSGDKRQDDSLVHRGSINTPGITLGLVPRVQSKDRPAIADKL